MRLWAQYVALGLATLAFIIALVPRRYTEQYHAGGNLRLIMWPKLLKFPLFWVGIAYFGLILCQILNPAWSYRSSVQGWWLERIPYVTWLPHGIEGTPFRIMNGWRTMMIHGAAWLMLCALWVGITRRKALLILLITLVCNAVLLGGLAAAQRITNTNDIFWGVPSSNIIWGTFFYRNHGAAWFNLMVPIACGLAAWYQLRDLRTFAKSSPSAVFGFLAFVLGTMVIVSHSRGGAIALVLFFSVFFIAYTIRHLTLPAYPRRQVILCVLALLFSAFTAVGLRQLNAKETWTRMEQLFEAKADESVVARQLSTKATLDLWRTDPWFGQGAGGFRYLFPLYQQNYPLIWASMIWDNKTKRLEPKGQRLFWEYAHNDPAQALAELGVIGISLFFFGGLCWLYMAIRRNVFSNLMGLALVIGWLATLFHSWGEFVLHCPAILLMWVALPLIAVQWCERDGRRQ